jgi:16S rRNA A1518/A1519 N6-dimethyltransferase RsmA/KsgA/DIM1 with predicted DNA glycosylase/AP lyase activity
VLESDVLQVDYRAVATLRGGPLVVVGNLPYYITSQILFSFVDCAPVVRRAVVTMQWEVAQRLVAKPRTPDYGILSVVFQLYAKPTVAFKIPPTVFYPQPKVDSALCVIDFWPTREPFPCAAADLRRVITAAFQQRRKMLRQSLKPLLKEAAEARQAAGGLAETGSGEGAAALLLPEEWGVRRPEELKPEEFLELTLLVFGAQAERAQDETRVWRHAKHGDW